MSKGLICDCCHKVICLEDEPGFNDYSKIDIESNKVTGTYHLCNRCFKRFAIDYLNYTKDYFESLEITEG